MDDIAIEPRTHERLARLSDETHRSGSDLVNEALQQFLDYQEWSIARIREGIAAADCGEVVDDDRVRAWLDSLGTADELPMPRSRAE